MSTHVNILQTQCDRMISYTYICVIMCDHTISCVTTSDIIGVVIISFLNSSIYSNESPKMVSIHVDRWYCMCLHVSACVCMVISNV